jgi:F-type H+-transporting ATPase subunit gamma
MSNLKNLKNRIQGIKSTQKITRAMKMIAASKLRRAKVQISEAVYYVAAVLNILKAASLGDVSHNSLLTKQCKSNCSLVIVVTSDRGLCGGFNHRVVIAARHRIQELQREGREVKILFIGKKGHDELKFANLDCEMEVIDSFAKKVVSYQDVMKTTQIIIKDHEAEKFDDCQIFYSWAITTIHQEVNTKQLIPLEDLTFDHKSQDLMVSEDSRLEDFEFEPTKQGVLNELVPLAIAAQLYNIMLNSSVAEQSARMTAMDNASSNASDMIKNLTLVYNRSRQASITKELIEIISGAEAI